MLNFVNPQKTTVTSIDAIQLVRTVHIIGNKGKRLRINKVVELKKYVIMMKMITDIEIENFRILKNTKINNIGPLLALVGKNNVGKSSVLLALHKLFNSETTDDCDKNNNSFFNKVFLSAKMNDGTKIDYYPRPKDEEIFIQKDGTMGFLSDVLIGPAVNFVYFSTENSFNNDFGEMTVEELINKHKETTQLQSCLQELKKEIYEILELFSLINDLNPLLSIKNEKKKNFLLRLFNCDIDLKFVINEFMGNYFISLRDIHKLIVRKKEIYKYLDKNNIDKKYKTIFDKIFNIIDKFKVDYHDYWQAAYVDEDTKDKMNCFNYTGDSTIITEELKHINYDTKHNRFTDKYGTTWFEEYKERIQEAYFHGSDKITIIDDTFLKKYDYYNLLLFGTAEKIERRAAVLRRDLDEYIQRKIDTNIVNLWEPLLHDIAQNNTVPIRNQGSGVKRLCAIFNHSVKCYRDDSLHNIPTIFAIDEAELSLHPSQQRIFVNILKDLSKHFQILITTHSPYIVNQLDERNVCVLKLKTLKDKSGNTIYHEGNPIKRVSTQVMDNRIIKYQSMAEINYLAFDEPSITYHQELYGQIEVESYGESNGNIIETIWKGDNTIWNTLISEYNCIPNRPFEIKVKNEFTSPDNDGKDKNGKTLYYYVPYCVRNSIDHPGDMNAKWKNNISVVNLSIKMLIIIAKTIQKAENMFLTTSNSTSQDLDDFGYETFKCSGTSISDVHSLVFWVKYQIEHPNECLIKQNRSGQNNPNGEIKNKINFVKAMNDIDPDWLTK